MLNTQRNTYMILMTRIEDLEEQIETLENEDADTSDLALLREKLAHEKNELARISDGCGTPHHH